MWKGDVAVSFRGAIMEMDNSAHISDKFPSRRAKQQSANSTKTERKVIEKNRRNQMKTLFANLNSLIPKESSKEALPLPDQIDDAINYIKSLEAKLKKSQEEKERLSGSRKRSFSGSTSSCEATPNSKAPQLKIREMGSNLEVVLTTGLDNHFVFTEVIRILQEEDVEIISASYSVAGNSIFHVVHTEMRESEFSFGAVRVTERLNRFINGSTSEIELELDLWDFNDINPETWAF